jgi:hypothetical protein
MKQSSPEDTEVEAVAMAYNSAFSLHPPKNFKIFPPKIFPSKNARSVGEGGASPVMMII